MRRNDLNEAKRLDTKALVEKVKLLRGEISDLILDKNMNKLKDLKSISKKRKDLAQYLTIAKQKELLAGFEKVQQEEEKPKSNLKKEKEGTKE